MARLRNSAAGSAGFSPSRKQAWLLAAWLTTLAAPALAQADGAARLHALEAELAQPLRDSPFHAPLLLASTEADNIARGDVHALLPHPFSTVQAALHKPAQWCEVLVLHLNVKRCEPRADRITLYLGPKHRQPIEQAYRLPLRFMLPFDGAGFLHVELQAGSGPLGTQDYRFLFEAAPSRDGQTFVHFEYQVGYGALAQFLMQGYLLTAGRDKQGFSLVQPAGGGTPEPVGGLRGAIERNTLRYQLAIVAYLDSLDTPEDGRLERRLQAWFDATERYAPQLHEISRLDYLVMKRAEAVAN